LSGGELEFLDEPWHNDRPVSNVRGIDGAPEPSSSPLTPNVPNPSYRLEHMRVGPGHSYLCFIPPEPPAHDNSFEAQPEVTQTLLQSWSLLQPLSGKCLYHRQGWFTYSYCHNSHVRQFREQPHVHPHLAGYKPEEDPEWEAYTLGQAPENPESGADLSIAEQNALAVNLELARGAGNRYLVQRWGDGTTCDKTGREREIEIQFHCSMTMTDTILFIKETSTCHYVLVIQTPRLCGDPVFRSRLENREESTIRCREIISSLEQLEQNNEPLTEAAVPLHIAISDRERPAPPPIKQETATPPPRPKTDRTAVFAILGQLRKKGIANTFTVIDGGLILEDIDEDGNIIIAYEVDLDGVDAIGAVKGRQYDLTEQVINAFWKGEISDEEDTEEFEIEVENNRPLDEL